MAQQTVQINYYPHPPQQLFHSDRYNVRYRLVSAGTGGGKTFAGVFEDLAWMLDHPGIEGIIFEPTYNMIKRILIRETFEKPQFFGKIIEAHPLVAEYHKTEMRLDLVNGSRVWFIGLDKPEAAEGSSIDFAHIDEARLVPKFEEAWESVQRRLRGSGRGDYPIGSWITTTPTPPDPNPENINSLYNFFENPKTKDPQSRVYRWSLLDNVYLPQEYKDAMLRSHKYLAPVFIYGRFANIGIGSFAFDYTRHVIGETNCPYKQVPEDFSVVLGGIDWGWTNPAAIAIWGLDGDGRAFMLDEFYASRQSPDTIIAEAKSMQEQYDVQAFVCGSEEPGNIEKARQNGVRAHPRKSKRTEGFMEMGGRFPDAGDGKPRIFFHRRCVNMISEVQVFDEEKPENDHAIDATRYAFERIRRGGYSIGTIPW
jgi:hypothetical protein